jgi:lipoic acid synthetase
MTLRVRWLGRVPYREALDLQTARFEHGSDQTLLLLEHQHVFTYGARAELAKNLLVDPSTVGADLVAVNRGGDVTYHGPGQLVGYPILTLEPKWGSGGTGLADSVRYVRSVEQLVIDTLTDLGLSRVGRLREYPGVWVDPDGEHPRKVCAIGVRLTRGRTMHGFAINVDPDMAYLRNYIIPCGIADLAVTSLREEGLSVTLSEVVDRLVDRAAVLWGAGTL